jgi:CheY-like chemotaxis protein
MVEVIPSMQYTEPFPLEKATTRKCILVVENDVTNAALLCEVISKGTSHHIFVASNAFAALKFVRHIIPHLLILNKSLPDMDGFELYTRLHTMKELCNVPTLMLGTQVPPIDTDNCEVTCIDKPFDSDKLITAIEALTNPPSVYFVHRFN